MYIKLIEKIIQDKRPFILATILEVSGSAPRHIGSKMLIDENGVSEGTIGGGTLEKIVLEKSKEVFKNKYTKLVEVSMLSESAYSKDMICGGTSKILLQFITKDEVEVFIEIKKILDIGKSVETILNIKNGNLKIKNTLSIKNGKVKKINFDDNKNLFFDIILPPEQLILFGAGYINKALYTVALNLSFEIIVVDDRKEFANLTRFPKAKQIIIKPWDIHLNENIFNELTYIVIATKNHINDIDVLRQVLNKSKAYLGCIGSTKKTNILKNALIKEGYNSELVRSMHSPIGLKIGGETPEEIAISIMAEIIGVKYEKKKN